MAAYYPPPPAHYQYYEAPPPPPPGAAAHPAHPAVAQPLHHQQYLPPQTQFVNYAPPLYPQSSHDEVRTLFIAGLPEDVKAREIYNLFREFPGYESSHLRTTASTQPFAFAVFVDQQSAVMALHTLNGMVFDLEKGSTLYIDLAKSNPRSKRLRTDDESAASEKRMKSSASSRGTDSAGVGSIHMPGTGNSAHNTIGYSSTQSEGSFDERAANDSSKKLNSTPCPTLFVANLGPTCSEQELIQVFSRCPGFLKLKMQSTYGAPVAFVDFQDSATSSEALNHLQGTVLYSSPSGQGMRLEYAKSRMGLRSKKSR
ncbi:uncharacterized protein [Coffea arabica]|uniref:Uncharacterized protein isoform X1 n=1 Tax=Coffea arabica TaxID=13443 RepID=A0A6P6T4U3_COFAR|nr:U1 small nuclear ribonucleoprotein A-like isoform X1 [Coffea arabica]